jgi:hypothetical protein
VWLRLPEASPENSKRRHVDSFIGPDVEEAVNFITLIITVVRSNIHVLGWRQWRVRG